VFYRELGKVIAGKRPGPAHKALAELEANGKLSGVITQNIDGLHQAAGSQKVYEVHGNCRRLECIQCKSLKQLDAEVLEGDFVPLCEECRFPLKPNVVLFGEAVHEMDRVTDLVRACDRLLVVGTSASVYPIAGIPSVVQGSGGKTFEFNLEETRISFSSDFCLRGRTDEVLPDFVECVLRH
jgi:NAD-dependent deacetylase